MAETVNQGTNENTVQGQERTFTQADVDRIISDRLKRERDAWAASEEGYKSEIAKANEQIAKNKTEIDKYKGDIAAREAREKVSVETGVPVHLLTASTEDECKKQAENLLAWNGKSPKYPNVKDVGESKGTPSGKTRDQFANWFNEALKK